MEQQEEAIENFIVVGNPGAGKSTLLNGMIGRNAFLRGISIGSGKTFRFDKAIENRIRYCDTPGLDDPLLRQQAAEQIRLALQQDGYYRIVFVVTLEAGRVKPADKATIRLVLNATSQVTTSQYSIVVNKVSTPEARRLADPDQFSLLKTALFSQIPVVTDRIHLNKLDYELLDADDDSDVVMNMSDELRRFLREAPRIKVNSGQVSHIQWDEFERTVAAAEEANRRLKESQEEVKRERARFEKEIADAKAAEKARADKAIADEKARSDKEIAELKAQKDQEKADNDKRIAELQAYNDRLKAAEEQARKDKQLADENKLIALINAAQKAHDDEIARKEAELTRVRQEISNLPGLVDAIRRHKIYRDQHIKALREGRVYYIDNKGIKHKNSDCKVQQEKYIVELELAHSRIIADARRLGQM